MRKLIQTIFVFTITGCTIFAQENNHRFELTATLGFDYLQIERFKQTADLDFLNYADSTELIEPAIVKLGLRYAIRDNLDVYASAIMISDLAPDKFDILLDYHLNNKLLVGVGIKRHTLYITYFEEFHEQSHPNYNIMDTNVRQLRNNNISFYVLPGYQFIQSNRFKATIFLEFGLSSFAKEEAAFYLKKQYSNEIRLFFYETKLAFQPYISPAMELRLNLGNNQKSSPGILLQTSYSIAKRSMNYHRSTQVWTSANALNEDVKAPKHNYARFEFNLGVYWAF